MSEFRLKEALKLYNERLKQLNILNDRPKREGFMTQDELGTHLYPISAYKERHGKNFDLQNYKNTVHTSIQELVSGRMKRVEKWWPNKVSEVLGVDPNFLFNRPSPHDQDFNKLVNKKNDKQRKSRTRS